MPAPTITESQIKVLLKQASFEGICAVKMMLVHPTAAEILDKIKPVIAGTRMYDVPNYPTTLAGRFL
jgi:hypothetical protein